MIELHYYTDKLTALPVERDFVKFEPMPSVVGDIAPMALPQARYKVTVSVEVDDSSYRYRALMRKPQLILKFSLPEYIDFPVGTWCVYQNETYTLNSDKNLKKNGKRNISYDMTLGSDEDKLGLYKFRNTVDGRLKFSMCAKPHELVEEVVKNLNAREGANVWSVGQPVIESTEKTVEFNHVYIDAALQSIADTFETEWEIVDHVVYLRKVEYNKDNPLPLSYGRGNGFVPGLGRTTDLDEAPIKRIYTQGGTRNINRSKYGGAGSDFPEYATTSAELLLPPSQTLEYEGRTYRTDAQGYYVERIDKVSTAVKEDSLDCSEIYPSRVGKVSRVVTANPQKHFYDIIDTSIPSTLDYSQLYIEGETPTIIFQSGMLAGKEFEFKYIHADRRFEIVPQEIDGIIMPDPDTGYMPVEGNEYAVFGIMLPKQYFFDNATKTGASWDMFREAAKKLYENEDPKFTFKGDLQGLWAKRNWLNIGGKIKVGGYILFTDDQFAVDGVAIRITGIKDYVNSPYAPTLEISNSVSGATVRSELSKIENTEVVIDDKADSILQFTKRRFRDAKETIEMLEDAMLDNFTNAISPVAVQTMAALIGDESLQFRFVRSKSSLVAVAYSIAYDQKKKQLTCPHGYLQHMTLGITSVSSSHSNDEYKVWEMAAFTSPVLTETAQKYYLYALVDKNNTDAVGQFALSTSSLPLEGTGKLGDISLSGKYCLWVGVLNSEQNEERSFASLYGFTEILPGRITTDKIVSTDGQSWLNLETGDMKLGDCLEYINNTLKLKFLLSENANLGGWIFRNNRLESQDGTIWLDGTKGDVNLSGILRLSTAYFDRDAGESSIKPAHIVTLQPTTTPLSISLSVGKDQVGKVYRIFNSNPLGGRSHSILAYDFSYGDGYAHGTTYLTYEIAPQEVLELTCFRTAENQASWVLSNRFSFQEFRNTGAVGRHPLMLAMGRVTWDSGSSKATISGRTYDGKSLSSVMSVSREKKGVFNVSFDAGVIPSGYRVFANGYGTETVDVRIAEITSTSFKVAGSDDASLNDTSFDFFILNNNYWWYGN